jgi:hypothetical protein
MKMSDTIAELATALAKAQGQIDDASKGSENPYFKSKYADLAAVRAVIREPLATNDLAIIQAPRVVQGGAEVETMLVHKSGEFMSETLFMPAGKADPHGYASAITYARRIGIMSLLALASYDDDGNTAVDSVKSQPVQKAKPSADVMAAANKAAKEGTPALTAWWQSLSKDDRALIDNDTIKALKAAAKEADGSNE